MLINRRNALMTEKRLPYDAEVEYLGTNPDGAYIDTQIPFPTQGRVRCRFYVDGNRSYGPSIRCWLFADASNSPFIFQQWYSGGRINFVTGLTATLISESWSNKIIDSDNTFSGSQGTVMFFGRCSSVTGGAPRIAGACAKDRLYYLIIEDSAGNIICDLIPVRVGTVGYLYDRVSGKIFGNAGTGAFSYGNDLKYPIPSE